MRKTSKLAFITLLAIFFPLLSLSNMESVGAAACVSGNVRYDTNHNARFDFIPTDTWMAGVRVVLRTVPDDDFAPIIGFADTDANGQYTICNDEIVSGEQYYGYVYPGGDYYLDQSTKNWRPVTGGGLVSFLIDDTRGRVSGVAFEDYNNNGVMDANEIPVQGVVVNTVQGVYTAEISDKEFTQTTAVDGIYDFDNIKHYWSFYIGSPVLIDFNASKSGYISPPQFDYLKTSVVNTHDFPMRGTATLQGTVFVDLNEDGLQNDTGGYSGVSVTVVRSDGAPLRNAAGNVVSGNLSTDASGN